MQTTTPNEGATGPNPSQPAYAGPTNPQHPDQSSDHHPQEHQGQQAPVNRPWLRRPPVLTAIAGGVLAVTAFLSGAAVGHAWDGNSSGDTGQFGPGGGRFGNPNFQGGQPGAGQNGTGQNGTGQNGTVPGTGQLPGQSGQTGQDPNAQGTTQTTAAVVTTAAVTVPAGHRHPAIGLGVYEVWLTPATIPDPVTRSV